MRNFLIKVLATINFSGIIYTSKKERIPNGKEKKKKPKKKNGNENKIILITAILSLVTALINLVAGILKALNQ